MIIIDSLHLVSPAHDGKFVGELQSDVPH
jgi:hypothetical protein